MLVGNSEGCRIPNDTISMNGKSNRYDFFVDHFRVISALETRGCPGTGAKKHSMRTGPAKALPERLIGCAPLNITCLDVIFLHDGDHALTNKMESLPLCFLIFFVRDV